MKSSKTTTPQMQGTQSMLAEFVRAIADLSIKAAGSRKVETGDPRKLTLEWTDQVREFNIPPPLRKHSVLGFDDFVAGVQRWNVESRAVVFHNGSHIVCVIDDEDRRDVIHMALNLSETFELISEINERSYDHKGFVKLLKNDLRGHVGEFLLGMVRKLEVSTGGKTGGEILTGRERGVREFQAELANAVDIPEVVDVSLSVYSNTGLRVDRTVRCSLDVELPVLNFKLAPFPDEVEIAAENAQLEIGAKLRKALKDVPVFFGQP